MEILPLDLSDNPDGAIVSDKIHFELKSESAATA